MSATEAERVAFVVEYLKDEGMESSTAGNYDGSLEHMAERLLDGLGKIDRSVSAPSTVARHEELLADLRKQLLVERARVGAECFDVADIMPIVKAVLAEATRERDEARSREHHALQDEADARARGMAASRDGRWFVDEAFSDCKRALQRELSAMGMHSGDVVAQRLAQACLTPIEGMNAASTPAARVEPDAITVTHLADALATFKSCHEPGVCKLGFYASAEFWETVLGVLERTKSR